MRLRDDFSADRRNIAQLRAEKRKDSIMFNGFNIDDRTCGKINNQKNVEYSRVQRVLMSVINILIFLLFGANFVSAAEKSLDSGTLDWLYSAGKTTSESAYTLTETNEVSGNTITK